MLLVGVLAAGASVGAAAAASLTRIDRPAAATAEAQRGDPFHAGPTLPPAAPCHRVVVIGDSLMDNSRPWLVGGLQQAGYVFTVDARPSRKIPSTVRRPYSGVLAAADVRANWGDADCWVVALGSNDLAYGGGVPTSAGAMIDEMLAAVTPGAQVWWVNVDYHRDPRTSFDFVRATAVFNAQLDARADEGRLRVIDWQSYAEANLHWFFDPVHVDRPGSIARANQTVAALAG